MLYHVRTKVSEYVISDSSIDNLVNIKKNIFFSYNHLSFDELPPGALEQHNSWELAYVSHGSVCIETDTRKHFMEENEILFIAPNKPHMAREYNHKNASVLFLSFDIKSKLMDIFYNYKTKLSPDCKYIMDKLINEGIKTFNYSKKDGSYRLWQKKDAPLGGTQMYRSYIEQLLIYLLREICTAKTFKTYENKAEFLDNLFDSICEHLANNIYTNISIEELCQKTNYSKSYISRIFKSKSGMSIMEYHTKLKIDEACKLICEKKNTIYHISEKLGFNNQYYFSKVFKKHVGMTPNQYKKAYKNV